MQKYILFMKEEIFPAFFRSATSKINNQPCVELPAGKVVWNGILYVVRIGDPIVGADVFDAEQVEHVGSDPDVLKMTEEAFVHDGVVTSGQLVAESDVHALVGGCAEIAGLIALSGDGLRQSARYYSFQVELHSLVSREIVFEEERYVITRAVGEGGFSGFANGLLRLH